MDLASQVTNASFQADIVTCLNQFFGTLEGLEPVISPVLTFITKFFAHTSGVFVASTTTETVSTEETITTTTTTSLTVTEEEEYDNVISLCVEFLLGLESVPGENSDILPPTCSLLYTLSRYDSAIARYLQLLIYFQKHGIGISPFGGYQSLDPSWSPE